MHKRIFNYFLITILLSIVISSFVFFSLTKNLYKDNTQTFLLTITNSIKEQINEKEDYDYDELAKYYSKLYSNDEFDLRITFIDRNGKVLGESDYDYKEMEDHSNRLEIQKAFKEGKGESSRYSETIESELLYIAVHIEKQDIVLRTSIPFSRLREVYQDIGKYIFIASSLALLVSLIIAFSLSYSITKPLNKLSNTAKEIYMGNLDKRVNIETKDELSDLAKVFNNMTDKLQKNINNLKYENVKMNAIVNSMKDGLIALDKDKRIILINREICNLFNIVDEDLSTGQDIIDVIRNSQINNLVEKSFEKNKSFTNEFTLIVENEERIYNAYTTTIKRTDSHNGGMLLFIQDITETRKLENIRTEFVSNVSHELKTPLTSIRGFVETLKNGAIEDKEMAAKFIDIIDIEAERLFNLINDILELSEIENNNKYIQNEVIKIHDITEEVFKLLIQKAKEKNIELINKTGEEKIKVDKHRLMQLLINLVDNAIKYNKEGGKVSVTAKDTKRGVAITVQDTGIGLESNETKRIFERFYRVDKGRSRESGGTGLGLSIVKHIVLMLNGDIRVKSQLGEGSLFIITLPKTIDDKN